MVQLVLVRPHDSNAGFWAIAPVLAAATERGKCAHIVRYSLSPEYIFQSLGYDAVGSLVILKYESRDVIHPNDLRWGIDANSRKDKYGSFR